MSAVPTPRPRYPGEFAFVMRRDPLALFSTLTAEYGDVVRIPMGRRSIFVLAHPDHAREILVTNQRNFKKGRALEHARLLLGDGLLTSEGEQHLRQRRLMQPAFHRQRIAAYGETMVRYAERRCARWAEGEPLDVHAEMMALTLAVVGKTLFDADVENEARDIGEALMNSFESLAALFYIPFGTWMARLPLPVSLRLKAGKKRLQETVQRIIAERRASGADTGDLLSMLLSARDAEGDGTGMSDQQIQDESLTLVLAGHETTANALSWTFYLLAQHPEVEARFHAELDALGNEPLEAETMARLPFTRMVLSESMRLYPPAWGIGRRALGEFSVGGFRIPAGAIIVLSPYLTQRDPRWYDEPERFDPDRWLPERVAERHKFCYFPFGAGPRICIGEQFAWMEGMLVLATIGRRWRLQLVSKEPVRTNAMLTLRPRGGLPMRTEARVRAPLRDALAVAPTSDL